jgi:hypothetical protein
MEGEDRRQKENWHEHLARMNPCRAARLTNLWDAETSDTEGDGSTTYEESHVTGTGFWTNLDDDNDVEM